MRLISCISAVLLFSPVTGYSGECEKNTARESVVCLEEKIDILTKQIKGLEVNILGLKDSSYLPVNEKVEIVPILGIPDPKITATDTSNSIQFDVISCRHSRLGAECEIGITSNRNDTDIYIYNNSRAYDENGNEFEIGKISIANNSSDLTNKKYITHRIIEGVSVRAAITFTNVPKNSTRITAIDMYGFRDRDLSYDQYRVHAKLRNLVLLQ